MNDLAEDPALTFDDFLQNLLASLDQDADSLEAAAAEEFGEPEAAAEGEALEEPDDEGEADPEADLEAEPEPEPEPEP